MSDHCQKCGRPLLGNNPWSIMLGKHKKIYTVCNDCKEAFEKWMDQRDCNENCWRFRHGKCETKNKDDTCDKPKMYTIEVK